MRLIKPDFKITREHGVWFQRGGFEMCAVYHPSALLRDPHKKEDMLVDMKSVKAKLDELRQMTIDIGIVLDAVLTLFFLIW